MRREIPLGITFITGFVAIIGFFVPHKPLGDIEQRFLIWYSIIAGFTMLLGIDTLIGLHYTKIRRREAGFGYSAILIATLIVTLIIGFWSGIKTGSPFNIGTPFMFMYTYVYVPLSSTMFSLLAFFIASAAYRAFRARNIDAALLLIAGTVVMLGRVPIGDILWDKLPGIAEWIMNIPQLAAKRGILIGVALGMITTSLRILIGIERTYLR